MSYCLQNPPMHGLQPVSNIRQSASEQNRHRVSDVGPSHLLMELHGQNPTRVIVDNGDASLGIFIFLLGEDAGTRGGRRRRGGGNGKEAAGGGRKEERVTVVMVVEAEEGGGETESRRKSHWRRNRLR